MNSRIDLVILTVLLISRTLCVTIKATKASLLHKGMTSSGGFIRSQNTSSPLQCAARCASEASCFSFAVDQPKGLCNLSAETTPSLVSYQNAKWYRLYKDYNYTTNVGLYKVVMDDGRTWFEHKAICQADGGHLITITDQSMFDWLAAVLTTFWDPSAMPYYFHVDGTDSSVVGSWVDRRNQTIWLPAGFTISNTGVECAGLLGFGGIYEMVPQTCLGSGTGIGFVCQI